MDTGTLKEYLSVLKLSNAELSALLETSERTVQRWQSGQVPVPRAIERTLQAWLYLEYAGLPWRPDGVPLVHAHPNGKVTIALGFGTETFINVEEILSEVAERGGASAPWIVDIGHRRATLGHAWIKFRPLLSGGFIPQSFGRTDIAPDLVRDRRIIEDGCARISNAIKQAFDMQHALNWYEVAV